MFEEVPVVRPLSHETYDNNLDRRVKEPEMNTDAAYSFVAQLAMSDVGEIGEFHARITQVTERNHELAKAGLLLCLLDPRDEQPITFMDVNSRNGLITPINSNRRLVIPEFNIGKITEGYLLNGPAELSPREIGELSHLYNHATPSEYTDTRTKAFELSGIYLGSD